MAESSPWTRGCGMALTSLVMIVLGACAAPPAPKLGPAPGDAASAPAAETESVASENASALRDAADAGVASDILPEDAAIDEPEPELPSPEEIDREIRLMLGDDPMGLILAPDRRNAQLPLERNERVESWINYFQNVIPERFGLYLERKGKHEAMIRRKLRAAGVPQDLLYLALIESGMNPRAYSRARAAGMWQFIASTGRAYDLEVSFWVDERRDPDKATDAALRFLTDLYQEFGSWYLAAAAYNGGPGRIRRGLRRVEGGTFWDLADRRLLRRETRDYVPKLIAAAIIGHHPERYGFGDVVPQTPDEVTRVLVPDATSFDMLAEAAGTDQETIQALNPEFPRRVTPPNRAVTIKIPAADAAEFETRYAAIPPDERVTWTYHVVTRGQTLGQIARRYGVSVAGIRGANNNVNPRRLQIGQRLVIPNPARLASSQRTNRRADPSSTSIETREGPVTVVVRRGDSLWSIARRFSVSTGDIMQWNGLSSAVIHPGDRLEIKP